MASDSLRRRCAIYTRKSTEEGLDKAFNSLDAQREACAAYVMSQQHEGWTLVPDVYDDGGYSGGTIQRPALQQLLADVRAGRVDVVVVYKIDRLTRSLSDFDVTPAFHPAATRDRPLLSRRSAGEATGGFKPARCFSSPAANAAGVA